MAGRGPAPKDPQKRVRRNSDPVALRVIHADPVSQPGLPEEFEWPERTREWWRMWDESPLSSDFTQTDWDFLLDTAVLHARFWNGDTSVAGELRLRVAKFGATPEDRARLRITFAQADEADGKRAEPKSSARERRGPLKAAEELNSYAN